jgi:hypothetical protein
MCKITQPRVVTDPVINAPRDAGCAWLGDRCASGMTAVSQATLLPSLGIAPDIERAKLEWELGTDVSRHAAITQARALPVAVCATLSLPVPPPFFARARAGGNSPTLFGLRACKPLQQAACARDVRRQTTY